MAAKAGISAAVSELSTLHEDDLKQRILARPRPRHVAVIMDGNGRWATNRGLPRVAGHGEGVKSVRAVVRTAGELGIQFLTLYAFSSENWNRPHQEVSTLMALLERSIERELPELMERNVRFRVIGRADGVPARVGERIQRLIETTSRNTGLTLLMAFNYGGRGELRLSNFLLWQVAYTELWMTPTLWPDFGAREFCLAVADFQQRDRRFGKV